MTKGERANIRKAIKLLMGDECQLAEALAILGPMVGLVYAPSEVGELRNVSPAVIAARPNQAFRYRRVKRKARP